MVFNLKFPFKVRKISHHPSSSAIFPMGEVYIIEGIEYNHENRLVAKAVPEGGEGLTFGMSIDAPVFELVDTDNVVSIFSAKKAKPKREKPAQLFSEVMKLNEQNKKRMAEERLKANRGVLRSYRMKP